MSRFHPSACTIGPRRFQPASVCLSSNSRNFPGKARAQIGARPVPEIDWRGAPLRTGAAVATRIGASADARRQRRLCAAPAPAADGRRNRAFVPVSAGAVRLRLRRAPLAKAEERGHGRARFSGAANPQQPEARRPAGCYSRSERAEALTYVRNTSAPAGSTPREGAQYSERNQ
jgi:hypothetical protein